MTDMLESGVTWLETKRHANMTQSVVYSRSADSVALSATKGVSRGEGADEFGRVVNWESVDWVVRASDLVIAGAAAKPERGDQIKHTVGSTTYTYEVLPPSPEEPCYQYDRFKQRFRIHSKLVS